ncbi:MAG: hypothetical protein ABII00_07835 [Elusimicrobiota bacterium]
MMRAFRSLAAPAAACLLLLAQSAVAQVKAVPKLNPGVGSGAGAAGAAVTGTGASGGPGADLNLSAPTLDGTILPSAASPKPVIRTNARPALRPSGMPGPAPAVEKNLAPAADPQGMPGPVPAVEKNAAAAVNPQGMPSPMPAAGSESTREGLNRVRERTRELDDLISEMASGPAAGEKAASVGSGIFDGSAAQSRPTLADPAMDRAATAVQRYIRSIMGSQKPTAKQGRALFEMALEDQGIGLDSALGRAVEARLFPEDAAAKRERLSGIDPRFRHFGDVIVELADQFGVTSRHVEGLIKENREVTGLLAIERDKDTLRSVLSRLLQRDRVLRLTDGYPENAQGSFLRSMGKDILAPSGKSVEEISRSGAFAYVNFHGRSVRDAKSGRDPDNASPDQVFYVTLEPDGRWKIGGYRKNFRQPGTDAEYIAIFRKWLVSGGVPESHFTSATP